MKDYMEERIKNLAQYCIETNATVREIAKVFSVSKSTVHKDLTERLLTINLVLYAKVRKVLQKNKEERHIRGGEATRRKYLPVREQK